MKRRSTSAESVMRSKGEKKNEWANAKPSQLSTGETVLYFTRGTILRGGENQHKRQQQRTHNTVKSSSAALSFLGSKSCPGVSRAQTSKMTSKSTHSNGNALGSAVHQDFNANSGCAGRGLAPTPTPFTTFANTKQAVPSYSLIVDEFKTKGIIMSKDDINSAILPDSASIDHVGLVMESVSHTTKPAPSFCCDQPTIGTGVAAIKEGKNNGSSGKCTDNFVVRSDSNAVVVAGATNNNKDKEGHSPTVSVQQKKCQEVKQPLSAASSPERSTSAHERHVAPANFDTTSTVGVGGATLASSARPAVALSVYLVSFYKQINEAYCRKRRLEGPSPKYNNGYDDSDGHYLVIFGEEILNRYTVQEVLGKGSFGTVLRCYDEKRRENVALKITRNGLSFRAQAKLELDILLKLSANHNFGQLVVKLLKVFDWQSHIVLVFELLSLNLYQLTKYMPFNSVTLDLVRKFAYQLVYALYQLEHTKPNPIIHCDIKPENILLKNKHRSAIRLIDFGSACYSNKVVHKYIQSRYYRSPEVILYLEYGPAIDRWSLGCVLVELHTGVPLFDGRTEAAQLALFEAMLGPIPIDMLEASPKLAKFYEKKGTEYQLKEPSLPRRSLETILGVTTGGPGGVRKGVPGHSEKDYHQFQSFIGGLLQYRPSERMSCHDALRHPFLEPLWTIEKQKQKQQQLRQPQKQQ